MNVAVASSRNIDRNVEKIIAQSDERKIENVDVAVEFLFLAGGPLVILEF